MPFPHVSQNWPLIVQATVETLYMVGLSLLLAVLIGLPLGVVLLVTSPGHLRPNAVLYHALGVVVNVFRSVPYIVLILWTIPLSRFLIGTSFGTNAAVISLTLGTAPFFARLAEGAMREVDRGVIEAAKAMGATDFAIVTRVLIPESLPGILSGVTVTAVALVSFSAMAGLVAGGGLGAMAWNYGYNSFQTDTLFVTTVILVLIVQVVQMLGDRFVRAVDRR
ncbi:methionine ABC transporter permease [Brockia lithotrophica]|uniref:D-methionine transport system permease protein n=1 Tax=Brockia lithotrophica TaxID=933949 RepID=A0A660L427_9BACL|nr:methionine ABC transporter permease [Brockia lithotrophica]RKQ88697.1 D-methionine transport system permease protein [Brockia lithotrophica]